MSARTGLLGMLAGCVISFSSFSQPSYAADALHAQVLQFKRADTVPKALSAYYDQVRQDAKILGDDVVFYTAPVDFNPDNSGFFVIADSNSQCSDVAGCPIDGFRINGNSADRIFSVQAQNIALETDSARVASGEEEFPAIFTNIPPDAIDPKTNIVTAPERAGSIWRWDGKQYRAVDR